LTNKELQVAIASKLDVTQLEAEKLINATIEALTGKLREDKTLSMHGFGAFEVRQKKERLTVNPLTKERSMVPAKKALAFKPSTVYKEKIKELPRV
jgi:DNA-binding protein HU-beta